MKINYRAYGLLYTIGLLLFTQCTGNSGRDINVQSTTATANFAGFASQEAWGAHLVKTSGCSDCHTPKKMGPHGPVDDSSLWLSGHPEKLPPPKVDRIAMEKQGFAVTSTMTSWVGPWGISYAPNITSDPTGIGNWQESNFITAIREGKYMGIESGRPLMPPMPWQGYRNMTDAELKAIFAYLKSTKPVKNVAPALEPPALASR